MFWSWHVGAATECCCRMLLEGAAVRVAYAFSSWPAGAAAGCCCGVLLAKNIYIYIHIYVESVFI